MILAGGGFWVGFVLYATNAGESVHDCSSASRSGQLFTERLASSVFRSVNFHLRNSPDAVNVLGSRIKLEDPPWGELCRAEPVPGEL